MLLNTPHPHAMILQVSHQLRYTYSEPVTLNPHTVYLYPKNYPHQRLIEYRLQIEPKPSAVVQNLDFEGNIQQVIYFAKSVPTQSLMVSVDTKVLSDDFSALDFVIYPFDAAQLPFKYSDRKINHLQPYLVRSGVTTYLEQYARQIAALARWSTVSFLVNLCQTIKRDFLYEIRLEGAPLPPEHTLISKKGSCRDFAVLFMACCRSLGIAARFVSGYMYGDLIQEHELHAWVEVYLPGAGWRGFDPTEGQVVGSNYIQLASAADATLVAPMAGAFNGHARSQLTADVWVQNISQGSSGQSQNQQ